MAKTVAELQDEINNLLNGFQTNNFDVWYVTINKKIKKRKSFSTIKEVEKWCKANKDKVIITSGSWQVFEIMKAYK